MNTRSQFRSIAAIIVLVLSVLPSFGCRTSPAANQLRLIVNSGVEGDALKDAARDYELATGIRIKITEFPYDDLFAKELIDLNAGTGAYDLIMLDDPWFPRFSTDNLLTELGPLYQKRGRAGPGDDFVPASIALCRYPYENGPLYALPYVGNSQLFFYRADLFKKHGLTEPATWADVLTAARTISERETGGPEGRGRVYGYVMRAARGNSAVADFMPIFWSFGAEMFDDSGRPTVNSAQGIEALKFMIELGKYSPPGYASFNATEVSAHLLQGSAAMSINWPAWISAFADPAKSKVVGKMSFATMPGMSAAGASPNENPVDPASMISREVVVGRAEIGNWLIAIPKSSRNVDAAFDFLLWVTDEKQMKKSAIAGNPPTRRSVFTDPELLATFPSYPAQLESLETSRPRPRTPMWNEIENVFGIFISRANSGDLSAEDAMNQANVEIARIVDRGRP